MTNRTDEKMPGVQVTAAPMMHSMDFHAGQVPVDRADPDAKAMLKEFNNLPMPNQNLNDAEIKQYIQYFHWIDAQPPGSVKTSSGGH